MADSINVDISGDDLVGNITAAIEALSQLSAPLESEAKFIIEVAQARVPYITGKLHNSADVVGINVEEGESGQHVVFGFGTSTAPYAATVHETPGGRGWKFLEGPLMEAIVGMEDRLASEAAAAFPSIVRGSQ